MIGERRAEQIKIGIGSAWPLKEPLEASLRGRDLVTGLPKEVMINDGQVREAISRTVRLLVSNIKATVEETPPELVADIMDRGIMLAGGGALLRGLDRLVARETQMPVQLADDPLTCVVRGTGVILEDLDNLREILVDSKYETPPK